MKHDLVVDIDFNFDQKIIRISDNAGGVKESELNYLISPGASSNMEGEKTIGIFGVGTKRAVIALSQDIKITSRFKKQRTYSIEYDEDWLAEDDWTLPYYRVNDIDDGSTIIELQKLRISFSQNDIDYLRDHLSTIYARFIEKDNFKILLNGELVVPITFANWAFPPGYEPVKYKGKITLSTNRDVEVEVIAGLTTESSPAGGEYGVYFYCNERLIVKALKTPEVGFIKGIAGQPHPSLSTARFIVSFDGAAIDMPWNSSKSDVNTNHPVFREFQTWLLDIVKNITSLSRRTAGDWPSTVFKYKEGKIKEIHVADFKSGAKNYLLSLPRVNVKYEEKISNDNASVVKSKPWVRGLSESIVAVEYLSRQRLKTKNRISLIILDSSLEIAFKEFLVHNTEKYYSDNKVLQIFEKRHLVIKAVKEHISPEEITEEEWAKVSHYYNLRCKLIHERATVDISDSDIADLRQVTEKILGILFGLTF